MILTTVVAAVFLGMTAQILAERLKLPAILPLLLFGMAAGPYALGLMEPHSLGEVLEVGIHLGVAVILFEGGLSLNLQQLARVGGAVRNLLTVGVLVTWVGAAAAAHYLTGMPWGAASLFGAIMTVTGPTVIVPLLRHMIAPRRVKTVLVSEGLIVDPIGAVLAYLVLQWIERAGVPLPALAQELLVLGAFGVGIGFIGGKLGVVFASARVASAELRNLTILAIVLVTYLVSELLAPQSGILAVVIMGITMSAANIPDLEPLRTFKEQLTTLLISGLFILLAGQLDLGAMLDLGWRGLLVALALIFVLRPLQVFLVVPGNQLDVKERTLLAMTAPRGIVAAAVASLAARQLTDSGVEGGTTLEGLVYLCILITGIWATIVAFLLPRWLGFADDPKRRLTVLVGANPLSGALARVLGESGRQIKVVDAVGGKLEELRRQGIGTVRGDARDASTYERAGVERDTQFLALTTNDELNLLASELAHHEFGVEHPVVALAAPSPEFGSQRRAWMDLLGGRAVQVDLWQRRLENGRARLLHVPLEHAEAADRLREIEEDLGGEAFIVCGWLAGEPRFRVSLDNLERLDRITLLVTQGEAERRLETLLAELTALQAAEAETREPGEETGESPEPAPRPLTHSSE